MASITIMHSHRNLLFAAEVANATGATFEEDGQWITISDSPQLEIPRYAFDHVFDPEGARAHRGENIERIWRSLLLNKRGHLVHFDEHEIVIADEKPAKPAGFLLRFPSDEEKAQAEEWAERAGFDSLTAYILAAVEAFNRHWQEQAGFSPVRED
jgi:hypothetical protein